MKNKKSVYFRACEQSAESNPQRHYSDVQNETQVQFSRHHRTKDDRNPEDFNRRKILNELLWADGDGVTGYDLTSG